VTDDSRRPGSTARPGLRLPPLYPIIDIDICRLRGMDPLRLANACMSGGVRFLQVRQKGTEAGGAAWLETVRAIVHAARPLGATVIVNDRADIAAMAGADGVHVGQDDMSPADARAIAGSGAILGLSTHTPEQVDAALAGTVDYIAVGPVFLTRTKDTGYDTRGLELVRRAAGRGTPVVAIGGITLANGREVLAAGADSLAIISDLMTDTDVATRVRQFLSSCHR
jgi:thiamine-phosphate pyrophosphorylase